MKRGILNKLQSRAYFRKVSEKKYGVNIKVEHEPTSLAPNPKI